VDGWEECVRGADVVVEATRLSAPEPLLRTEWIGPGALVVPYGTMSAVELSLTDIMDKVVVDDWGQAGAGPLGALRAHVDSGRSVAGSRVMSSSTFTPEPPRDVGARTQQVARRRRGWAVAESPWKQWPGRPQSRQRLDHRRISTVRVRVR
jgi:hypothetical protein